MRAFDIETKSYHDIVSIDFTEGYAVLRSDEYGSTRQSLDRIKIILEKSDPKLKKETYSLNRIEYRLGRLRARGYTITTLGEHIKATKGTEDLKGSIGFVYKAVFGYS